MASSLKFPFTPDVKAILSFIGSRKRTVNVFDGFSGKAVALYTYWDNGSRAQYTGWRDGRPLYVPVNGHPIYDVKGAPVMWVPQPGDILVRHGITNGTPATPSLTYYK